MISLADPNLAYLLLTIGLLGILAEFFHPGVIVPGVAGATALVLAFLALAQLPVNWLAVLLIVVGIGAVGADLALVGTRFLAIAGVVVFVLGSLLLYARAPFSIYDPYAMVNPYLIAIVGVSMTVFFVGVGRAVRRLRSQPIVSGTAGLIGREGVVESPIAPRGRVRVDSESWTAELQEGERPIAAGERIVVADVQGVMLRVRRVNRED